MPLIIKWRAVFSRGRARAPDELWKCVACRYLLKACAQRFRDIKVLRRWSRDRAGVQQTAAAAWLSGGSFLRADALFSSFLRFTGGGLPWIYSQQRWRSKPNLLLTAAVTLKPFQDAP